MTKEERIRRTLLVCCNFVRNLAYYKVGQDIQWQTMFDEGALNFNFWRQINANCLDICVLDWCKLFGDPKGQHHWSKTISDNSKFKKELLANLSQGEDEFLRIVKEMRQYRDKFIAHLDSGNVMNIPILAPAKCSIYFLYDYIAKNEFPSVDFGNLPKSLHDLDLGYKECSNEATRIMSVNAQN